MAEQETDITGMKELILSNVNFLYPNEDEDTVFTIIVSTWINAETKKYSYQASVVKDEGLQIPRTVLKARAWTTAGGAVKDLLDLSGIRIQACNRLGPRRIRTDANGWTWECDGLRDA